MGKAGNLKENIQNIIALTPAQEGMLSHYLLEPEDGAFRERLQVRLEGEVDRESFISAWRHVTADNEALRTVFRWEYVPQPLQLALKHHEPNIQFSKIGDRHLDWTPDLRHVPFRVTLCQTDSQSFEMTLEYHHIILDGWSSGIVLQEFFEAYDASLAGKQPPKHDKPSFKEYVRFLKDQDKTAQENFWKNYLDGVGDGGDAIRRRSKSPVQPDFNSFSFHQDLVCSIDTFNREHKTTTAALLYTAWGLLLAQLHQTTDARFDTTVSGRNAAIDGIQRMTGLLINTLPLRVTAQKEQPLLETVRELTDFLNRRQPYETCPRHIINTILEKNALDGLFDSLLVLENYPLDQSLSDPERPLRIDSYEIVEKTPYDLTLIVETGEGLDVGITYNALLFNREDIALLAARFEALTAAIVSRPDAAAGPLLSDIEGLEDIAAQLRDLAQQESAEGQTPHVAPRDKLEEDLIKIWSGVLGKEEAGIGIDHDFFAFGGHSLLASALANTVKRTLDVKLPLAEIFRNPTIRQLASFIRGDVVKKEDDLPLQAAPSGEHHPASSAQKRLYFIWLMDPESIAYNGPVKIKIKGELERDRLQQAFASLIQRHEALRTSFEMEEGVPKQKIHLQVDIEIEELDSDRFIRPFDMGRAPLMRVGLNSTGDSHTLMVDIHHIVCDGTSRDIIVNDFAALLQEQTLEPLGFQFKDFCHWQELQLEKKRWAVERDYWLRQFSPLPEPLDLPLDFPRPAKQENRGKRRRFQMPAEQARQLDRLQNRFRLTRFMACQSILSILLSLYCRANDVTLGTAVAGRHHGELDDTVGLFMETLALRTAPEKDKTLAVFLAEVRCLTLDAFESQRYPFRQMLKDLEVEPGQSRSPLFDVMLIVQNHQRRELRLPGLEIEVEDVDAGVAKVDLTWEVYDQPQCVEVELEYNTQLLTGETVERMWKHWLYVLSQIADTPSAAIGSLDLATEEEKRQILNDFNDIQSKPFTAPPVPLQLLQTIEKRKDSTALVGDENQWLSYNAFLQKASALASKLIALGVKEGEPVALMMERSTEMIVGLVGVMLAGGAYVPLDPAYPADRVSYILSDSDASIMVVDERNISRVLEKVQAILVGGADDEDVDLSNWQPAEIESTQAAYIIYTSGSTGRPKGVVVEHQNLSSYIAAFCSRYPVTADDVVMQQASITFDASCEEIWPVLLGGGRVVVASGDDTRDVARLAEKIARYNATIIDCSPLLLGELNRAPQGLLRTLRLMINGGDVLKREYIDQLLKLGLVVNTYGPTETTICATYYDCADDVSDPIPIGSPVPGYRNVIINEEGRLQPVGIPGELCIAGPGVTRGYLNRPRLSEEKFVETDLFEESDGRLRMYRSGDLACWKADGNIRFLGRVDRQVKIRGFRIELEEIENALLKEPAISKAAVIPRSEEGREAYLCAYIVAAEQEEADIHHLRTALSNQLPSYMVPAYFVTLDTLPLTASGKVDARRLPKPERQDLYSSREFIAPRNEGERQVAGILKNLLKLERIGVHDDFFEMGGDSILANRTLARIREELGGEISLRSFFQSPTVEGLARTIEGGVEERISIPRASRDQEIPLSYPQERLWFLRQLDGDNSAYIIPRALRLKGRLQPALFERSLTEIVRRHEILRTVFVTVEGRPTQVVKPMFEFKIPVVDLSGTAIEDQPQAIERFIVDEGNRPFDFETGPLIRMHLLKLAAEEHILVSVEHHLIHDGWTQGVLLREFFTIYQAFLENKPAPMPELPIQYADYAVWQRSYMAGERLERYIDFWKGKLDGLEPLLELPLDAPRPPVLSGRGEMKRLVIPSTLASSLYSFGKEHGTTLFMTMLAVFKALLHRYSGCEDLVVGSGIANRRYKELEGMLGMVINTLVLRTTIEGSMRFEECARAVKETALEAYEYEEAPFDKVVEAVSPERSLSYMPVFQVMFSFMDTPTARLSLPGLEFEIEGSHNQSSKFDINVVVIPPREEDELEGEILVDWEYNTDLFKPSTMDAMMRRYQNLLDYCARHPEALVSRLPLLQEDEKEELLFTFNNTAVDYPRDMAIPDLFRREVASAPDRTALIEGDRLITYRELESRAKALAAQLISFGVALDEPVAITAERSIHMMVGVIGILMAGGAYLPISRDFPLERKRYMVEDAAAKLWLYDGEEERVANVRYLSLREPLEIEGGTGYKIEGLSGDSLAYIMYTSGSTGKPKGVMVTHRNVARLVKPLSFVNVDEGDCFLPTGPLEFDASTFELWGGLLNGVPLCLVSRDVIIDVSKLKAAIRRYGVTTMWITVALFNQVLDTDIEVFRPLRNVLAGGDALSAAHINRLRERFPYIFIMNGYGPTENTTFSTTFWVDRAYSGSIPIGRPIANSTAYVLDPSGNPQPIGVPGELWVGGDGVARGYLNSPQTTAEKFVTLDGRRLYRTGDRARWLDGGVLEFLGRIDQQVKIRGFRIELGEIENWLSKHEGVAEAVVLAVDSGGGDKVLVAYVVDTVDPVDTLADELEGYLRLRLPAFMVPSAFVFVEKIPLTANGKVDRRGLPLSAVPPSSAFAEACSDFEKRLASVWGEILGVDTEKIGRDFDFFRLGGHSLKAARLGALIHKEFSVRLPLAEVFQFSTLAEMAERIEASGGEAFLEIPLTEEKDFYPVSSAQKRLYIVQQLDPGSTVYNIPLAVSLPEGVDRSRLEEIFRRLIERHESLRTSFHVVDGESVQQVHEGVAFRLEERPVTIENFVRPFDLARAPLFRAALWNKGDSPLLLMDMHHIIGDGVSMGILERDYAALAAGGELEPLELQYRDYAAWQLGSYKEGLLEKQERFWLSHLEAPLPVLELPLDFPRSGKQDFVGDRLLFEIDGELTAALRQLAANTDSTLYMVLLSGFYVVLSRLSGQDDMVVGTPVAARRHADLQKIVGIFINTLALRQSPSQEETVEAFLRRVKEAALQAFENQEYPFDRLVDKVGATSDPSRNPLFDVMFALENTREAMPADEGKDSEKPMIQRPVSRFDMTWNGTERGGAIFFSVEFRTGLFKRQTIRRWQEFYRNVVSQMAVDSSRQIRMIELMSDSERERVVSEFNATATAYPSESSIVDLFKRQVEETPDAIVLISAEQQVSYRALDNLSDMAAARLAAGGVKLEDIVGLKMPRSNEMVTAMLGILKAEAAYLPINANLPESRQKQLIVDSNLEVVLTEADFIDGVFRREAAAAEDWRAPGASNLAYIMYTSGSTGIPKGVMVEHRSVVRLVKNTDYIEFPAGGRLLQTGALEFDASTFEIWGALLNGLTLVLESKNDILVASSFKWIVSRYDIEILFLTTALFAQLLDADPEVYRGVKWLLFGGEVVAPTSVRKMTELYPDVRLIHCYGPTENTTFSTAIHIEPPVAEPVPIGGPIANSTAYALDRRDRVQPVGIFGELALGGDGVARGYLNRPVLTAEKFVDLNAPLGRVYRSGDLARYDDDGVLEFGGRIDQQVKIRGFRIELGEIENWLSKYEKVVEAVVLAVDSGGGGKTLVAYVVAAVDPVDSVDALADELTGYLEGVVPAFMVPSAFVFVEKIPLNNNGKVDRVALPLPERRKSVLVEEPASWLERRLADVWSRELGIPVESIGRDSDFFQLGGHSLKAANLVSSIHKEFSARMPLTDVFETSVLKDMALYIEAAGRQDFQEIPFAEERDYYPLSSAQQRLFVIQHMDPAATVYNMPFLIWPDRELPVETLNSLMQRLIQRHDILRTSFDTVGNQPVQRIHKQVEFQVEVVEGAQPVQRRIGEFIRPFDLSNAPLIRMGMVDTGEPGRCLVLDMHHIICDGVSTELLVGELEALLKGRELPPLTLRYHDFAVWQTAGKENGVLAKQEKYWLEEFEGSLPVLELPTDFPRPTKANFGGDQVVLTIDSQLPKLLNTLARESGTTLFMVLLSSFFVLLAKLSGQEDMVVGSPVAGRRHADLESIVGIFINLLALRQQPRKDLTFAEFMAQVKSTTIPAFENQDYPFERLVEQVQHQRGPGRNPIFDTMFALQNMVNGGGELTRNDGDKWMHRDVSRFDMTFNGRESADALHFYIEYKTSLFKRETIERWRDHFIQILEQAAANSSMRIRDISILSEEERSKILYDWNDRGCDYPADQSIPEQFHRRAQQSPDAVALVFKDECVTYREMMIRAQRRGRYLIRLGVKNEDVVAIMKEKSNELMIDVLGILSAGAAYVPISKDYPETRKNIILKDCNVNIVLDGSEEEELESGEAVLPRIDSSQLAYIMYTSGSTGNPKGVAVEHRHVTRLVRSTDCVQALEGEHWLQTVAMEFDVSVFEIWNALLNGAVLHIIRKSQLLDIAYLKEMISRHQIEAVFLTPPLLSELFNRDPEFLKGVKRFSVGGEVVPPQLANALRRRFPTMEVFNLYGPTENGVWSTSFKVTDEFQQKVPIGKPIHNSTAYIMDSDLKLLPTGIYGELLVGGEGVARGYVNAPELTADKFVSLDQPGLSCLYRTGDRARWMEDGNIEFAGRFDHQVKIRGIRIEIGEIENRFSRHPKVQDAVVIARRDSNDTKYLAAYITLNDTIVEDHTPLLTELKTFLAEGLPDYMVPSAIMILDELPKNVSGKVDKRKLPEPRLEQPVLNPPVKRIEKRLAAIWAQVLAISESSIGIESNFFELGGYSLNATTLMSMIHETFGKKISFDQLFSYPTLHGMASLLESGSSDFFQEIGPAETKEFYRVSSSQQRICLYSEAHPNGTEYNMPGLFLLNGRLDRKKFQHSLDAIVKRQASLRTSFHQINGIPVQKIHEAATCPITFTSCGEEEVFQRIKAIVQPFKLSVPPLLRVEIFAVGAEKHIIFFDIHHSISDGFSMEILMRELLQVYSGGTLHQPAIQYKDYAEWQGRVIDSDTMRQSEDFWLNQLKGLAPTRIPADHLGVFKSVSGNTASLLMEMDQFSRIKTYCSEHGVTRFVFYLALFFTVLKNEIEQDDITVGTPISLRDRKELKDLVGVFLNVVLLRCRLDGAESFIDVLSMTKTMVIEALNHSSYPYEWLDLKLKQRQPGLGDELFTILFNYFPREESFNVTGEDFNLVPLENELELVPKYDLSLYLYEEADRMLIKVMYKANLFEAARVRRILDGIGKLCAAVLEGNNSLETHSKEENREQDDFFDQMSEFYAE